MTKLTDGERLAVVENEVQNVKNEVKEVKDLVRDGFNNLNAKLDSTASVFVTKEEHISAITQIKAKRWSENTLSAIMGAVLMGTIGYILLAIFKP